MAANANPAGQPMPAPNIPTAVAPRESEIAHPISPPPAASLKMVLILLLMDKVDS